MSDDPSQPDVEPEEKPAQPKGAANTKPDGGVDTKPEIAVDTAPDGGTDVSSGAEPDIPPNRLSINPMSRFFDEEMLRRGIGIRFKGKKRTNVQEYCISEGWVTMAIGKTVDRRGLPLTVKSTGPVEAWYEDLGDDPPVASAG